MREHKEDSMRAITRTLSLVFIGLFSAVPAFATGSLSMVFTKPDATSFTKIEVQEENGAYTGQISSSGGFAQIQGGIKDGVLEVTMNKQKIHLQYTASNQKNTLREYYRGFFTDTRTAEILSFKDLKRNSIRMEITIGDDQANYTADAKWLLLNTKDFQWEARKIKNEPGSASGAIHEPNNPTNIYMDFYSESSGSLQDTLFQNSVDVVAWALPFLI